MLVLFLKHNLKLHEIHSADSFDSRLLAHYENGQRLEHVKLQDMDSVIGMRIDCAGLMMERNKLLAYGSQCLSPLYAIGIVVS